MKIVCSDCAHVIGKFYISTRSQMNHRLDRYCLWREAINLYEFHVPDMYPKCEKIRGNNGGSEVLSKIPEYDNVKQAGDARDFIQRRQIKAEMLNCQDVTLQTIQQYRSSNNQNKNPRKKSNSSELEFRFTQIKKQKHPQIAYDQVDKVVQEITFTKEDDDMLMLSPIQRNRIFLTDEKSNNTLRRQEYDDVEEEEEDELLQVFGLMKHKNKSQFNKSSKKRQSQKSNQKQPQCVQLFADSTMHGEKLKNLNNTKNLNPQLQTHSSKHKKLNDMTPTHQNSNDKQNKNTANYSQQRIQNTKLSNKPLQIQDLNTPNKDISKANSRGLISSNKKSSMRVETERSINSSSRKQIKLMMQESHKMQSFLEEQRRMGNVMQNAMAEISKWFTLFDSRLQKLEKQESYKDKSSSSQSARSDAKQRKKSIRA